MSSLSFAIQGVVVEEVDSVTQGSFLHPLMLYPVILNYIFVGLFCWFCLVGVFLKASEFFCCAQLTAIHFFGSELCSKCLQ